MEPRKRFGAEQRIRRQTTFKHLVEKGRFSRGEFFYLWVCKREAAGKKAPKAKPMIGIVVTRKTDPQAAGRNLWKRRVREIFRENQTKLHPQVSCLVKVRVTQKKPSFAAIEADLLSLFKNTGAWA